MDNREISWQLQEKMMEFQRATQKLNDTTRERDIIYSQLKTIRTAAKFVNMYSAKINQSFLHINMSQEYLTDKNKDFIGLIFHIIPSIKPSIFLIVCCCIKVFFCVCFESVHTKPLTSSIYLLPFETRRIKHVY